MAKIALDAGHGRFTPGKRCWKAIDPNETREWVLNSRIASYVETHLERCGVTTMRVDDTTGQTDVSLSKRVKKANNWGADLYLSFHANAGIRGKRGGGIANYSHTGSRRSAKLRDILYKHMIAETGLKGNRSNPCTTANFYVIRKTTMAACLMECGFMDSLDDTPIILTDDFARKCALGIAKGACEYLGIKFVDGSTPSKPTPAPTPSKPVAPPKPNKPTSNKINVDGSHGPRTTRRKQQIYGTKQDAIISGQPAVNKKYCYALEKGGCVRWTSGKASGSDMARAEQKDLKAKNYYKGKIDGYIGKQHVIAKQKFLRDKGFYKGKIDGYYGVETCKADQRWMNSL